MKRGEWAIERYIDALDEVAALTQAVALEGAMEDRTRLLKQAKDRVSERMRCLTGGQIGQAQRLIRARGTISIEESRYGKYPDVGAS